MKNHEIIKISSPKLELLIVRKDLIANWFINRAKSPFWRLYAPLNSNGAIRINGELRVLRPNSIYLIAPDTCFDTLELSGQIEKFYIHFIIDGDYDNSSNFMYEINDNPVLWDMTIKAGERLLKNDNTLSLKMLCCGIVFLALESLPSFFLEPKRYVEPCLVDIWQLIHETPFIDRSNAELAHLAHMSPSRFNHKFYDFFGISPQKYIQEERIRQACILLLNPKLSIDEVAERCGFCDRYYFTRIFTKTRNISPGAFRRQEHKMTTV